MIVWHMRGYTDPDGEFEGGEMSCAIEHAEGGYRFVVWHDDEIQTEEIHGSIDAARGKRRCSGLTCWRGDGWTKSREEEEVS